MIKYKGKGYLQDFFSLTWISKGVYILCGRGKLISPKYLYHGYVNE
jgi:hypothetical protein